MLFFFVAPLNCLLGIWTPEKAGILDQKSTIQSHMKMKGSKNYDGAHLVEKTKCGYPGYPVANAEMKRTGSCHNACCSYPKEILFVLLI